jgi:hypothetical protein
MRTKRCGKVYMDTGLGGNPQQHFLSKERTKMEGI